jgi:hypothetical protein
MATSGSKTVTVTSWDTLRFSWSESSQSIAENKTTITWKLELVATSSGRIQADGKQSWKVTINGVNYSGTTNVGISNNTTKILASGTATISHNSDGTKTFAYSFEQYFGIVFSGKSIGWIKGEGSGTLDTIPRTSSVSATSANIGSATTITINRASTSFTHTLSYVFGSLSGTIATKTTQTTVAWTIPATFYAQIPNSPSGECKITCTTYSGSTAIGSSDCVFVAIADLTACSPTVSISAVDVNNESLALSGNNKTVITGVSNLRVLTTAKANNSATIKSITVYCGGDAKTGADVTFSGAASKDVYAVVTDSRGYSTRVVDDSLSIINYIIPTIIPSVTRDTPTGDSVTVSLRGKWYNGSFQSVTNHLQIRVRYHKANESESNHSGYFNMPLTINGNEYSATLNLTGLDYRYAYTFVIRLDDAIFTDANGYRDAKFATVSLSKGIPVFDWGEDDFQFNVPVKLTGGLLTDYVIEEAYEGDWYYRKWAQGLSEAWYSKSLAPQPFTNKLADGLYSNDTYSAVVVDVPSGIFNFAPIFTSINAYSNVVMQSHVANASLTWVTYRLWTSYSASPSNMAVQIYVAGRWKQR